MRLRIYLGHLITSSMLCEDANSHSQLNTTRTIHDVLRRGVMHMKSAGITGRKKKDKIQRKLSYLSFYLTLLAAFMNASIFVTL